MLNKIQILPLDFGKIGIPKRWSLGEKLSQIENQYGIFEETMICKITGFLIDIDGKKILADTGLSLNAIINPIDALGSDLFGEFPIFADESNFVINQLKQNGLSVNDVDYIFLSHLHFDHAGGLEQFEQSRIIIGKEALEKLKTEKSTLKTTLEGNQVFSEPFRYKLEKNKQLICVNDDYIDLFNDGRIIILRADGHTNGHLSLILFSYKNPSDSIFNYEIFRYFTNALTERTKNQNSFMKFKNNIEECIILPFDAIFSEIHYLHEAISEESCSNHYAAIESMKLIKKFGNLPNSRIYFPHNVIDV